MFFYLGAVLDYYTDRNSTTFLSELSHAYDIHKMQIRKKQYLAKGTPEFFIEYDPIFPQIIAETILGQIPLEPLDESESEPPELKTVKNIINDLLKYIPSNPSILLLSAKIQFIYRDFNSSLLTIAKVIQDYPENSLGYLLRAKVFLIYLDLFI